LVHWRNSQRTGLHARAQLLFVQDAAIVALHGWRDGFTFPAPNGPPTRTESMVRYNTIATALEGMQKFEPMVNFDVDPASSLLCTVIIRRCSIKFTVPSWSAMPVTRVV
jgi:hypothetical protein